MLIDKAILSYLSSTLRWLRKGFCISFIYYYIFIRIRTWKYYQICVNDQALDSLCHTFKTMHILFGT